MAKKKVTKKKAVRKKVAAKKKQKPKVLKHSEMFVIPIHDENGVYLGDAYANKALFDLVMNMPATTSFTCGMQAPSEKDEAQQELPLTKADSDNN